MMGALDPGWLNSRDAGGVPEFARVGRADEEETDEKQAPNVDDPRVPGRF